MIKVEIQGLDKTLAALAGMEKQVRFATVKALTITAKDVEAATYAEFRRIFDRPTPTTMRSLRVKTARKDDLTAMVYVKDRPLGGKNKNSMAEILAHHFTGGSRAHKQLEDVLRVHGYIQPGQFVVPGGAAKVDPYGNMNRGQITQILSQIGLRRMGFDSTPTRSRRSRRNVAAAGTIFWAYGKAIASKQIPLIDKATGIVYGYKGGLGGRASTLPAGAWLRDGRSVRPLLLVVEATRYRKRIDLDAIARKVIDANFGKNFDRAFADAIRTAH